MGIGKVARSPFHDVNVKRSLIIVMLQEVILTRDVAQYKGCLCLSIMVRCERWMLIAIWPMTV